ncbi:C4-dicarboxylate ABC transporter substrate-binding protein [Vibrio sp. MACH09]|uniref:TRAP transporter substrate-binding protein n=1 Tax=unclassified Vibrio TaxID=2614977 RepID=UPI001493446D|nr:MULTISPECIES: TRAP transporter substrate-binding protein [unclassified Vibrio]NOI65699.1 TRAP transporter substrate-binding protein [Vibrio sp. 99-8-1]GLO62664.1 C4-dicarboxylate ABC transporter substrate-binding protein [Vibrio sp. MACH09]
MFGNKTAVATLMACAIGATASLPTYAATTLKLSHNQDRTHPVHKSMQYMADEVKKLTDGEVKIRIYPNGQLGTQRESMELMQNGALDMAKSNASEMESFEPAYGAFNIPYIFRDRDHYYRVLKGDVGEKILSASYDKGFVGLTYYDGGSRSFYANKAINTPADLKGMKIRVQPSPAAVNMIKLMGGSPTPLAYGELYTALQQGVVDGAENNPTALTNSRHGEVAKVYSLDEHTMIPDVLVISSKVWDKLSSDEQKALKKAAKDSMMYHKTLWSEMTNAALEKAKSSLGVKVVSVEKQPFVDAVKPMHDEALKNADIAEYVKGIDALAN